MTDMILLPPLASDGAPAIDQPVDPAADGSAVIACSPPMREAMAVAGRVAATALPVLLVGATGTGKEVLARFIHARSRRRGRLVDVNCGALPRDLADGMLFGHRRGAFTGAHETVVGLVEAADGGTLFLDELCSLPLDAQVKLLRMAETGRLRRVGDHVDRVANLRLIAAVQDEPATLVRMGRLRADLVARLAGVVIRLRPLSERRADIVPLALHGVAQLGRRLGPDAYSLLLNHHWPENVRELLLLLRRAAALSDRAELGPEDIRRAMRLGTAASSAARNPGEPAEAHRSLAAICEACGWNSRRIAAALAVSRATLFRRLREAGIRLSKKGVSASHVSLESV